MKDCEIIKRDASITYIQVKFQLFALNYIIRSVRVHIIIFFIILIHIIIISFFLLIRRKSR